MHHFAFVRAVASGVSPAAAAQTYLPLEQAGQAARIHRQLVVQLQGEARRAGLKDWRLLGVLIGARQRADEAPVSLQEWAEAAGLDGWSEDELQAMYSQAHPVDRRAARNERLRARQLALLRHLERAAVQPPSPDDGLDSWFDEGLARRLQGAGWHTFQQLTTAVATQPAWWRAARGVGPIKAERVVHYLRSLGIAISTRQDVGTTVVERTPALWSVPTIPAPVIVSSGSDRAHSSPTVSAPVSPSALDFGSLVDTWIDARAGSPCTARIYRRELQRLSLWCRAVRGVLPLAINEGDCAGYRQFLNAIPAAWTARGAREAGTAAGAPFRGALSLASQRQALVVISGCFEWLVAAGHLARNPWRLLSRRRQDDPAQSMLASRAFAPDEWLLLRNFVASLRAGLARERLLFLLDFGQATGLRASELVGARVGDLHPLEAGWVLQVHGKGAKNRLVALAPQAQGALQRFLAFRGWQDGLQQAPAELPLLCSLRDIRAPVGYQSLYRALKRSLHTLNASPQVGERGARRLKQASLHWLRHTCGTRALERGVPVSVLQSHLGHADPRSTMHYAKPQIHHVAQVMGATFPLAGGMDVVASSAVSGGSTVLPPAPNNVAFPARAAEEATTRASTRRG